MGKRCKPCNQSYQRDHYRSNKASYKEGALKRKRVVRLQIQELKDKTPCTDCKEFYSYYVTDYHHLDSTQKLSGISQMVTNGYSFKSVLKEIEKCELVCANCHRERTHAAMV